MVLEYFYLISLPDYPLELNYSPYILSSTLITNIASTKRPPSVNELNILSLFNSQVLEIQRQSVVLDPSSGAIGHNRNKYISVGLQKYSSYLINEGIISKNIDQITTGIKTLEYAFIYQKPDGSFPDYYRVEQEPQYSPVSVAFFLHDLGHSLLLLQNSDWFQTSSETANLRRKLETIANLANISLTWLVDQQDILSQDKKATNRIFIYASAYYLTGKALNRADVVKLGETFLQTALSQQSEAGFFWENGGFDSSYQGVSLNRAMWLYTNLQPQSVSLRQKLWLAIEKGTHWQLTRILPTGDVDTNNNTRVYTGGESFLGKKKGVAYVDIFMALNYYFQLSGDSQSQTKADLVMNFFVNLYKK